MNSKPNKWRLIRRTGAVASALLAASADAGSITVHSGSVVEVSEATFFSFDGDSIPFRRNLKLTMVAPEKHPKSVVQRGARGTFDELRAEYYGTVIKIDGEYRMWYVGYGFDDPHERTLKGVVANIGFATSRDGISWTKPKLGLVEFQGSKENNIVAIEPQDYTRTHPDRNVHVLYDPQDPDQSRRYKMVLYAPYEGDRWSGRGTMAPLLSADGLRWRYAFDAKTIEKPSDPGKLSFDASSMPFPAEHLEGGSLIRLGDLYYLNGQQLNLPDGRLTGRLMCTFWSPDFTHWHPEKALSFVRSGYDYDTPLGMGKEVHEGAALWNRGNVIVGIYGRWEGAKAWRDLGIDLGVISSVDAIHFAEPDPSFVFARRGAPGQWDSGGILQGQGFENIGEFTYIWYGSWNLAVSGDDLDSELDMLSSHGEIGLLKLRRDGFGHVSVLDPKDAKPHETFVTGEGSMMTVPFTVRGAAARIYLNAAMLKTGTLAVQLLDENGMPVSGYGLDEFVPMQDDGVHQRAVWRSRTEIPPGGPYRLRVIIKRREGSPRLYAVYVTTDTASDRR